MVTCVYSLLSLILSSPIDFFKKSSSLKLPIIDINISIQSFLLFTPIIIILTSIYSQLHLLIHWKTLTRLPARFPDGTKLTFKIYPFLFSFLSRTLNPFLSQKDKIVHPSRISFMVAKNFLRLLVFATFYSFWHKSMISQQKEIIILNAVIIIAYIFSIYWFNRIHFDLFKKHRIGQNAKFGISFDNQEHIIAAIAFIILSLSFFSFFPKHMPLLPWFKPKLSTIQYESTTENVDLSKHLSFSNRRANYSLGNNSVFDRVKFKSAQLFGSQFNNSSFQHCSFKGSIFSHSSLIETNFQHARLVQTEMSNCKLRNAKLGNATIASSNLSHCTMNGADLSSSSITRSIFRDADLTLAKFDSSKISESDFKNSDLTSSNFSNASLSQTAFSFVKSLSKTNFTRSFLSNVNFSSTKLFHVDFTKAVGFHKEEYKDKKAMSLIIKKGNEYNSSPDFSNSTIKSCQFDCTYFLASKFENSIIENCDFTYAKLRHSFFVDSMIYNASFESAELQETNFSNASLRRVSFSLANLDKAKFDNTCFLDVDLANVHNSSFEQLSRAIITKLTIVPHHFNRSERYALLSQSRQRLRDNIMAAAYTHPQMSGFFGMGWRLLDTRFFQVKENDPFFTGLLDSSQ